MNEGEEEREVLVEFFFLSFLYFVFVFRFLLSFLLFSVR